MDVALLRELGFCQGMENYSRHLAGLLALLVQKVKILTQLLRELGFCEGRRRALMFCLHEFRRLLMENYSRHFAGRAEGH